MFVSTYKFALLHSIADCCIERGADDDAELQITTMDLAEKFIDLYWSQSSIFPNGRDSDVLFQNTGRQAGIISQILKIREQEIKLSAIKSSHHYNKLKKEVSRIIQVMPLWKLQVVGSSVFDFLYPQVGKGNFITLNRGIPYCFRAFYGQVTDMLHAAWIRWIQKVAKNQIILGQNSSLETFLFESKRSDLKAYVPILKDEQSNRCFYCEKEIRGLSEVDHFIPWSKYPVDLGHNFVLAHKTCNGDKKDFLAAQEFYFKWNNRNQVSGDQLALLFEKSNLQHDLVASSAIADWAYNQCRINKGLVWLGYKSGFSLLN